MTNFERHAFTGFDAEAKALQDILRDMCEHIDGLLDYFIKILDAPESGYVPAKQIDKKINLLEIECDKKVYDVVTKYSPLGEEMRYIFSMVKVSYIYESAADKLKNCIKRRCRISGSFPVEIKASLRNMVKNIKQSLPLANSLLEKFDSSGLEKLAELKRMVSVDQKDAFSVLQTKSSATLSPQEVTDAHFIIKNIERISDKLLDLGKVGYFISYGKKFERD